MNIFIRTFITSLFVICVVGCGGEANSDASNSSEDTVSPDAMSEEEVESEMELNE